MRRTTRALVSILVVVVGGFGLAAPAGARDDTIVVKSGQSIQAAIDKAQAGDRIVVRHGTYHENLLITKDRITLVGRDATLEPPTTPVANVCADPTNPADANGICIAGQITAGPNGFTVQRRIRGVTVTGFTVRDFNDVGIFSIGSNGTSVIDNRLLDNGDYGVFANTATNTLIAHNRAANSAEAGIYVGDSPNANAKVIDNESSGSEFGIFVRDAEHGRIIDNRLHDNCVGNVYLADAPGPAGDFTATGNRVEHNNKVCPPNEDTPFPISGIGFAVIGAHDVHIRGNLIRGNAAVQPGPIAGGVVVGKGDPTGTAPVNNIVKNNEFRRNAPDISFDGSGTGNVFHDNECKTSVPDGLCAG